MTLEQNDQEILDEEELDEEELDEEELDEENLGAPKGPVDLLSQVATNPSLEKAGTILNYGGVRWRVASGDLPAFQLAQRRLLAPHAKRLRKGLALNQQLAIIAPAVGEHLLVGWDDEVVMNGKPFENTVGNRVRLVSDPRFLELLRQIVAHANDAENYRAEAESEDLGN